MTHELPWVLWARSLPLPQWDQWRQRADRIQARDASLASHPGEALEAALEAAWREMTSAAPETPQARPVAVYAVLDLETGSLEAETGAICSVAVMTLDEAMNEVTRYRRLVADELGKVYTARAREVNGLDPEQLKRYGTPVAQVIRELSAGIPGKKVVGHNVAFDLRFLAQRGIRVPESICTQAMARRIFPGQPCNLAAVATRLGVPQGKAHDAMGDVETTAGVFRELMRMQPIGSTAPRSSQRQLELTGDPTSCT